MICKHCLVEFEEKNCPSCGKKANRVKLTDRNYLHYYFKHDKNMDLIVAAKLLEVSVLKILVWRFLFLKPSKRKLKKMHELLPIKKIYNNSFFKDEKIISFERIQYKQLLKKFGYYDDDFRGIDNAEVHTPPSSFHYD